ncbi:hypothetical protein FHS72_001002 [Loktanella ponticola]|uniref:Uncharacterized protein n=1 Tax=Yoonia ponticola TaxID=1524255 RepID=A0A7W9BJ03_9RHOB|nr:hypothetical protein [Yoonia ponticola]
MVYTFLVGFARTSRETGSISMIMLMISRQQGILGNTRHPSKRRVY